MSLIVINFKSIWVSMGLSYSLVPRLHSLAFFLHKKPGVEPGNEAIKKNTTV